MFRSPHTFANDSLDVSADMGEVAMLDYNVNQNWLQLSKKSVGSEVDKGEIAARRQACKYQSF
jgi:hypothetical protein